MLLGVFVSRAERVRKLHALLTERRPHMYIGGGVLLLILIILLIILLL